MSAHWPVMRARPGSVVFTTAPVVRHRSVKSGRSDVLGRALLTPMSSGNGTEWLPTFGVSWQVVQVPMMTGWARASLSPVTPVMAIGCVLKSRAPRAIASRSRCFPVLGRRSHAA
jgi:hypothetical protein